MISRRIPVLAVSLVSQGIGFFALLVVLAIVRDVSWSGITRTSLRQPRPSLIQAGIVGAGDVTANALFALAAGRGLLSVLAVLGSLYPVATVLLAHVALGERITGIQRLGVLCAFTGVAFVSAG